MVLTSTILFEGAVNGVRKTSVKGKPALPALGHARHGGLGDCEISEMDERL